VDGFEYVWTVHSITHREADGPPEIIGQSKNLSWPVTLRAGYYIVTLAVTNPQNGHSAFHTTELSVSTMFSTGFFFLKETAEGNTELDFFSQAGEIGANLLRENFGASITGPPTSLGLYNSFWHFDPETGQRMHDRMIVPMGGMDMKVIRVADMELIHSYGGIFFSEMAPNQKPLRAFSSPVLPTRMDIFTLFTDQGFSISERAGLLNRIDRFASPTSPAGGVRFTGGSPIGSPTAQGGAVGTMFFDAANNRLIYFNATFAPVALSGTNGNDPSNINANLLYIGTTHQGGLGAPNAGWAIFECRVNPTTRFLYQLGQSTTEPISSIHTIDPALNFNNAQIYATNKSAEAHHILYGSVGDRLYMYNTGTHAERLLTLHGMGSGEEITMITHKPGIPDPRDNSDPPADGYLIIATYRAGNYTVYLYNLVGGATDGMPVAVFSGTGRIKDMQFVGGTAAYTQIH
jgi:hypothetical protein